MRLPRLTTRRLMLAVAIAAVGLALAIEIPRLWRASRLHRSIAVAYAQLESSSGPLIDSCRNAIERGTATREEFVRSSASADNLKELDQILEWERTNHELLKRRLAYFTHMKQKHDRAARYPWLPVTPDPPMPE